MVYAGSLDLLPGYLASLAAGLRVAGLWGIWHIASGGALAYVWRRGHAAKPAPTQSL